MAIEYKSLDDWIDAIDILRLSDDVRGILVDYASNLTARELPVIWNHEHLAMFLDIDAHSLAGMVNSTQHFYRTFNIPKRRGGLRELSAPYPTLLGAQRRILSAILSKIDISEHAHGFVTGRSIVTNAKLHLGKRYLLKLDIENFFPSIGIRRVIAVFMAMGYEHGIAYALSRLCCMNNALPQGAATSPQLSNIITKRLDRRVSALAIRRGLIYSRFADDMTFSGDYISTSFIKAVEQIIESEGFHLREDKTKLVRDKGKKIVTGISVSGEVLHLPKETKRKLRQEVHYLTNRGFFQHTAAIGISDPLYVERLLGKLSFWQQIEPDNLYVIKKLELVRTLQKELDVI